MVAYSEVVVRIDTDGVDAAAIARRLADALVELRIIVERPGQDPPYGPGPAAATVLEPGTEWIDRDDNGVQFYDERGVFHSFSNWVRPNCDRCGARLEREAVQAAFDEWPSAAEPVMTCTECGWTALLADWPAPWPFAVGAPAVVFRNWPKLDPQFLGEVREVLGGRTRVLRAILAM